MREVIRARSFSERLDSLIGLFSPRWAAERTAWRTIQAMSYRTARSTRTDRSMPSGGGADYHLESGYERDRILQRARALERDNAIAAGILERAVDNVIGTGMQLQVRTDDETWNETAEALWELEFVPNCEVRGLFDFGELQRATYLSQIRDGDVGTLKVETSDGGKLQAIEGDLIAAPAGARLNNRMVDGVELDGVGRPTSYWLIDESKTETRNNAGRDALLGTIQVPAERMIFLARRKRLGQTRGEPAFAQSAHLFDQVDGHIEAVVTAARMAACFGVMLRRTGGYPGVPTTESSDGVARKDFRLEPGMVKTLEQGEEVVTLSPAQPTQSFPDFLAMMGRILGLPFGLPLELVFLDFSRTNYSSARAALLQAYRRFRVEQERFIAHWLRPIWLWKVAEWIRDGRLPERADWRKHAWIAPRWQWIDPKAEAEGHLLAIDGGFETVAEVVTETGRDFSELVEARGRELKAMRAAGIPEVRSVGTRDPLPPQAPKDPAKKAEKTAAKMARLKAQEDDVTRDEMRTELQLMESRLFVALHARAPAAPPAAAPAPFAQLSLPGAQIHTSEGTVFRLEASPQLLDRAEAAATTVAASVDKLTTAAKEGAASVASAAQAIAEKRIDWPTIPTPPAPVVNNTIIAQPGEVRNEIKVEVEAKLPAQPKRVVEVSDGRGGTIKGTIGPA